MLSSDDPQFLLSAKLLRNRVKDFQKYPYCLPAINKIDSIDFHPKVTFFVGENGSGKSTLMEALAISWGFNPEGGSKNFNFATRSSHSDLHKSIRLAKSYRRARDGFFLRAESFYNVASNIDELDEQPASSPLIKNSYGGKSLHMQSHGESFFALLKERFGGYGMYFLDEPEAALSPTRQMAMLSRIHQLVMDGSQFVIATHSPILMAYPDAKIFLFSKDGIKETIYEETDHYLITKRFMNDYKNITSSLMMI